MKKAVITGITGQDGSYLAEFLLEKGYAVHGVIRRSSSSNTYRIDHLLNGRISFPGSLHLHDGDLADTSSLKRILDTVKPDEVYNLAAMSHVKISFEAPEYTVDINATGTIRLLDAIRQNHPQCRFYQASTSEMFGKVKEIPQTENTPFYPRSPYGVAKLYAYWAVVNYREAYNLFACNGILFNHESPRRGDNFVTRKITLGVARIKKKLQSKILLGNLNSKRDWGYAKDYVEGMWLMLQQNEPDDFILATGITTSIRDFVELAFREAEIDLQWEGEGLQEKGIHSRTGEVLVEISPEFFRPSEVDFLQGDATKAKNKLGWEPRTTIQDLVSIMMKGDLEFVENEIPAMMV